MEITLGPVLYDWPKDRLKGFYKEAAGWDVDTVYIGEVVCTKRKGLSAKELGEIAEDLTKAGKKVYLSTPAVVATEDELELVKGLAALGLPVEANDASALAVAEAGGLKIAAGPHITTYNASGMEFLKSVGVDRVTFPVELPKESVAFNTENTDLTTEVFAHGKVPLAFSWRCYTARSFGHTKENCHYECRQFPEGMEIKDLDKNPLFTINGTSILSADTYSLVDRVEELREMGLDALRISPHPEHTGEVIELFRKRIDGLVTPGDGVKAVKELTAGKICNGWFIGAAGKEFLMENEALVV